jgi:hypothetical protein
MAIALQLLWIVFLAWKPCLSMDNSKSRTYGVVPLYTQMDSGISFVLFHKISAEFDKHKGKGFVLLAVGLTHLPSLPQQDISFFASHFLIE